MKTVLFVCVGNTGLSRMAEAVFNKFAKGKAEEEEWQHLVRAAHRPPRESGFR